MISENRGQKNQKSNSKKTKSRYKSISPKNKISSKNNDFSEEMDNKAQIIIEIDKSIPENDENKDLNSMEPKIKKRNK